VAPLQALQQRMPPDMRIELAGAVEESAKGQAPSWPACRSWLFLMLTLLMLQLQSFSRAMLVC
jgi:multidrug efflux pump subunit AcrB